jgi:ferrochelatase
MPFLENVTRGRGVPGERLEAVAHHYLALGGVSPINAQNRALREALETELAARGIDLPVYWGNRNWDPFLAPELARLHADGHRRVLALATSAYSSYSGCRQYREDLARARSEAGLDGELVIDKVRVFFDHPGFVASFAAGVAGALTDTSAAGFAIEETIVLYTTHSIPLAMAAASGPPGRFDANGAYVAEHLAAIDAIHDRLRAAGHVVPRWRPVYQSRSGSPDVPWLEPDVNDALREAAGADTRAAVIVPVGFISDHVEVAWDLDHEAAETAAELGVRMVRVPTPGTDPVFVAGLVDLVAERACGAPRAALSAIGPWPDACPPGCCANLRGPLPAVAGSD